MADAISAGDDEPAMSAALVPARGQATQLSGPRRLTRVVSRMVTRLVEVVRLVKPPIDSDVVTLLEVHRKNYRHVNIEGVQTAYQVAERFHRGQMRKSGEAYITHPLAVATILARLGMDSTTIMAALLHDTVEDTRYTLAHLRNDFGDEVAHLVDGVTKLEKVHFGGAVEAETTRKMILAAARDVRVLLIKLADRLHNMRTLGAKSRESQVRIATVTQDILVPLAGRLGVQVLKRELEDLVLSALDSEAYRDIDEKVIARTRDREKLVAGIMQQLAGQMRMERIQVDILDRPRHYTSIYERQIEAGMPDHLCDDPRVVLVIKGSAADCYTALGVIHGKWRPVPGRFKDFIASPKFNLYKSLHTTVLTKEGQPLDILIRTEEMHRIAEYGIAAHHNALSHVEDGPCQDCWADESAELEWLQQLVDWQHEVTSGAYLESLRYGLADHEIVIFAGGQALSLPSDATPVDVAYALDTRMGDRCVGARINGHLASLASPLSDGDVIELVLSPSEYAGPERNWLDSVRSPRAKLQIKHWFDEQEAVLTGQDIDQERKRGRRALNAALKGRDRWLANTRPLVALARSFGFADTDGLYIALARGRLDAEQVTDRLIGMVDGIVLD